MKTLSCFKAYDIRGVVPDELDRDLAFKIGQAFVGCTGAKHVAIGHDIRLTGPELTHALAEGLRTAGADVIDMGQCGTEEIYHAVPFLEVDGGICVTASHNPANYNGMKFVGKGATPISADTGLNAMKQAITEQTLPVAAYKGQLSHRSLREDYVKLLMTFVEQEKLRPLKIVVNPGNGGAGEVITALESHLPFEFIKVHFEADGHFPNGVPNPLLPHNREVTKSAVLAHKADFGVAWDGDFDRCFFFDEHGQFIEGYYLVSLLAKALLAKQPNETIIYDPRLYWNTLATIQELDGNAVVSKTGHAFIKESMRRENALYGGEMSAHHYFRDFYYCDNGNIPWLLIAQLLSNLSTSLSSLVNAQQQAFPCSGEINLTVENASNILTELEQHFSSSALAISHIDGLGMEFDDWRFNVRSSNTEPLLRVNVETRANSALLEQKTQALLALIQ